MSLRGELVARFRNSPGEVSASCVITGIRRHQIERITIDLAKRSHFLRILQRAKNVCARTNHFPELLPGLLPFLNDLSDTKKRNSIRTIAEASEVVTRSHVR